MTETDRQDFSQLVSDAMAFYRQDVSTFAMGVWWAACERYDLEQVRKAFEAHAMSPDRGQFAPRPADLIRALEGTATDRAAVAWGKALDAAQRVGAYTDVVFDDPAIHAVVEDLGGWPKLCRSSMGELGYLQHRFTESYRAYVGRGKFDYPRMLCGDRSPDEMYARRGLPLPKPTAIGDVVRARLVWQGGAVTGKTVITLASIAEKAVTALIDCGPQRDAA